MTVLDFKHRCPLVQELKVCDKVYFNFSKASWSGQKSVGGAIVILSLLIGCLVTL